MGKILENIVPKTVNSDLEELVKINQSVKNLNSEMESTKKVISESFSECVIMFVDLVGSTEFKLKNPDSVWILRVKLFVDVISQYAKELSGNIVKIIGDEVMITFTREERDNDALNFVMRLKEIEKNLEKVTGYPTKIKIAFDSGAVCFIRYEGNIANDPQGTPVDRCARISKFCEASTVLTSENQVLRFDHKEIWKFIGKPNLKGIGNTSIYQLGEASIVAQDTLELPQIEYNQLLNYKDGNIKLKNKNIDLQNQIKELGKNPDPDASVADSEKDQDWNAIEEVIIKINSYIDKTPGASSQYARFLFLYQIGEKYKEDSFNGITFDTIKEAGIVEDELENGWYSIISSNKRNSKILPLIDELESMVDYHVREFGDLDEDDMFEYSVKDPEFWDKYIGYCVQ
jgi:class 3 adenylate cyclase